MAIEHMAEGTATQGPEIGSLPSQVSKPNEVTANASLSDKKRLQKAKELLQTNLTSGQEQALLKAHYEEKLPYKARILKEGNFTKEQRRTLMENYITGILPSSEFAGFDPNIYPADSPLRRIAEQIQATGNVGRADEDFLTRTSVRIERLIDEGGQGMDVAQAQELLINLESWRIDAVTPRSEQPAGPPSQSEQIINAINTLEEQIPTLAAGSTERVAAETELQNRRNEIDAVLEEVNRPELRMFSSSKEELSRLYYSSRVKVTNLEKEGKDEYQGRGKLQELRTRRQEYSTWEARTGFWNSPRAEELARNSGLSRDEFEQRYRGIINYFNQQSIDLIYEVVSDRKKYTSGDDPYPERVRRLVGIWDGPVVDAGGHVLKQQGENVIAQNFNDVRAAIEEVRRWEPWVPNRVDYETYIRFVADDLEELEEMIPYIVARVQRKLGTGSPNELSGSLQQEKGKMFAALAAFPVELITSEAQFRRVKSILASNLDLMGSYFFSGKVRDDWEPYFGYTNLLAEACEDTELQDHLVDSLLLDRDGLTVLALHEYFQEDGIFWRYGQKSANLARRARDINKLLAWQNQRRLAIAESLNGRRLKRMGVLLGLEPDRNGNTSIHPAFARLKVEFDTKDQEDGITIGTRWQEYIEKTRQWQEEGKFGDIREAERVTFQHPLARAFKAPTKNAQGQVEYEFLDMYEQDDQFQTDKWYKTTKERKVRSAMQNAERLARAFMADSASALAWHVFRTDAEVFEINRYLQDAGMDAITKNEALSQKTLFRALMQSLIRYDKTKLPKNRMFKIYDILTERLGIDLDIPTFSAWYFGWHDTDRPAVLIKAIEQDDRPGGLNSSPGIYPAPGMDEKNTGTMWAERERRLNLLMLLIVKGKYGRSGMYFNFPGHDTPGAGLKDVRNYLNLTFGQSRDTIWLNDLLIAAIPLVKDRLAELGCTRDPGPQMVGLHKGGNEVTFAESGYMGFIENPRDTKSWIKRAATYEEQVKATNSGDKEGWALLKDGPFSGVYRWRDFDLSNIRDGYIHKDHPKFFAIEKPDEAIMDMTEATYRAGVELARQVAAPLMKFMKMTVDSTVGANPGAARFANTLIWYAVSKWMDTSMEFRTKPGYAVDGNLAIARYFIHTAILEEGQNGLIYYDHEFDEIMLGYIRRPNGTRVIRYEVEIRNGQETTKDENGNWVSGEVEPGLIDAFPKPLRDEILNGRNVPIRDKAGNIVHTYIDYLLPFGLNSKRPETLATYYTDNDNVKRDYKVALQQVSPRRRVTRP